MCVIKYRNGRWAMERTMGVDGDSLETQTCLSKNNEELIFGDLVSGSLQLSISDNNRGYCRNDMG